MKKSIMMYSLGKDSSTAFIKAKEDGYDIDHIIVMFDEEKELSQIHLINKKLIKYFAENMKVKLTLIGKNKDFETHWRKIYIDVKKWGYDYMVHGDIFLEDVRKFKDDMSKGSGVENIYPLWGMKSKECAKYILEKGIDSYVTVTNKENLKSFLTKKYSEMLPLLPKEYDPCGENGEFHTIVFKAPFLTKNIEFDFTEIETLISTFEGKNYKYWYTIAKLKI